MLNVSINLFSLNLLQIIIVAVIIKLSETKDPLCEKCLRVCVCLTLVLLYYFIVYFKIQIHVHPRTRIPCQCLSTKTQRFSTILYTNQCITVDLTYRSIPFQSLVKM